MILHGDNLARVIKETEEWMRAHCFNQKGFQALGAYLEHRAAITHKASLSASTGEGALAGISKSNGYLECIEHINKLYESAGTVDDTEEDPSTEASQE